MGKKITNDQFKSRVFDLVGEEYVFLEEYNGSDNKIRVKHNVCGNEYQVTPYHFLCRKQRCPKCNKFRKRSSNDFLKEFKEALGDDYELLSEYKGAREPVLVKHRICGNIYSQIASEAKSGKGCLNCSRNKFIGCQLKDKQTFETEFSSLSNGEYELLSEYENDNSKIQIRHLACGYAYEVAAGAFLQGRRCPKCALQERAKKQTWTQEFFEKFVRKNGDDDYEVVGNYVNSQTKIAIRHKSCGHVYDVAPREFVQGKRCPSCNSSHGEQKIEKWLKLKKYDFERQFKFDDCKVKRQLPFDFAVFKNENVIVIEYQGIQHYQPISLFGGDSGYRKRVRYDNIKREYCKKNHIELIEIPYYYDDEKMFYTIKEKLCQS